MPGPIEGAIHADADAWMDEVVAAQNPRRANQYFIPPIVLNDAGIAQGDAIANNVQIRQMAWDDAQFQVQMAPVEQEIYVDQDGFIRKRDIPQVAPRAVAPRVRRKVKVKPAKEKNDMSPDSVGYYIKVATKGTFGIEIEVEGRNLLQAIAGKWTDKTDGSLRGESREYILRKPLDLDAAKEALVDLNKALTSNKAVLDFSFRTSVHVHVNVLDMNKKTLHSFLYLSHLFENVLVNYSGTERTGNRFCLRCSDAEYKVGIMYDFLTQNGFRGLNEDVIKYSAINIAPITTQGSVEFRSMRGTLDTAILYPWLDVLQNIRNMSQIMSVKDIAAEATSAPKELIKKVFGDYLHLFNYSGLEQDLRRNYSMLIEMPHLKLGT